ncbi:MAG: excinuclease ABC subunit UvrC [Gemmatimonadota bacterium]|nr:excinuclease ABC subunit UvrC [Gemmatimonadota bacterium]MDP6529982.1 excinuclease ABC subunit UvrC [Gemmatimonadota bacterium]MDP6802113.1 excinuclease ABC subunit UvrC [Gemmatimonadota bacterium]MDP7032048.1 excinuclease ABC subunit UvrC [Gemmatimonadota bacterium]
MSEASSSAVRRKRLAREAAELPRAPGVYLFRDDEGAVIYVGKAKVLRTRVRSYFAPTADPAVKVKRTVSQTDSVETIVTRTEVEALLLEYNLIREYRPRYNVVYRDDKRYPYLKVTLGEPYPRVVPTREVVEDGSRYFGPYTDVGSMRSALRALGAAFPLPTCRIRLTEGMSERGCLDHQLGRCVAPCRGDGDPAEYRRIVEEVMSFLGGRGVGILSALEEDMARASRDRRYEEAARIRDRLRSLRSTLETQHVTLGRGNLDALGFARDGSRGTGVLIHLREGRVVGRDRLDVECGPEDSPAEVARVLLLGFYRSRSTIPPQILLPARVADAPVLESWLGERAGRRVRLRVPSRGDGARLLEMADHNAAVAVGAGAERVETRDAALVELAAVLGLPGLPGRIEGFDISHVQGRDAYASLVVFRGGQPSRAEYRTFGIRTAARADDPGAIGEAVGRRAKTAREEGTIPDLVLVDGGEAQLEAARRALMEAGLGGVPVAALAKREEVVRLAGSPGEVCMKEGDHALALLQRVRDESHRFARRAHLRKRGKRMRESALDGIPGIGPKRRRALLRAFGSPEGLRLAGREGIAAVPGIGVELARAIWERMSGDAS